MHNVLVLIYPISSVMRQFFFSLTKNPKNLDPSSRLNLDLQDCLGSVSHIIGKFHRTDLVICSHSGEGKTPSYSQINKASLKFSATGSSRHKYIQKQKMAL